MPCNDGGGVYSRGRSEGTYADRHTIAHQKASLDKYARMLCGLCDRITATSIVDVPPVIHLDIELREWWIQHQLEDKAKEAREARELDKKNLRAHALSKLTAQERQVLGVSIDGD